MGNRTLYFNHDYAGETVKKRREYNGVKKALKQKGIRFQTPYTAPLGYGGPDIHQCTRGAAGAEATRFHVEEPETAKRAAWKHGFVNCWVRNRQQVGVREVQPQPREREKNSRSSRGDAMSIYEW